VERREGRLSSATGMAKVAATTSSISQQVWPWALRSGGLQRRGCGFGRASSRLIGTLGIAGPYTYIIAEVSPTGITSFRLLKCLKFRTNLARAGNGRFDYCPSRQCIGAAHGPDRVPSGTAKARSERSFRGDRR
jgi:hypothetical protein